MNLLMNKMNKKGTMFAIVIILTAVVVLMYAFSLAVTVSEHRSDKLTSPLAILNVHSEAKEAQFYIEESGKLSAHQASYDLLKNLPVNGNCTSLGDEEILFDGCAIDTSSLKTEFIDNFQKTFNLFLEEYISTYKVIPSQEGIATEIYSSVVSVSNFGNYDYTITNTILNARAKERLEYAQITLSYKVDPSFNLELPFDVLELDSIYKASKETASHCKKLPQVLDCAKQRTFGTNSFTVRVSKKSDYLIFTATTKERLFFEEQGKRYERADVTMAFSA